MLWPRTIATLDTITTQLLIETKLTSGNKGSFIKVILAYRESITMSSGRHAKVLLFWWK